jgi:hypothetical protein
LSGGTEENHESHQFAFPGRISNLVPPENKGVTAKPALSLFPVMIMMMIIIISRSSVIIIVLLAFHILRFILAFRILVQVSGRVALSSSWE